MTRESSNEASAAYNKDVSRVAHRIRIVGYSFFAGLALILSCFLVYNVVGDLREGAVYDPYTHLPLSQTEGSAVGASGESVTPE